MNTAGEHMISEIVGYISELVPIHVDKTKTELSSIMTKYHVTKVENEDVHPDLTEKIQLFLSSKRLEGLAERTLDGYAMELRIFADHVKKKADNITSADIRVFLGNFPNLKMSTVGKKLFALKSFFGWLAGEELIKRDPTAKLKPPKTEKRLPKALTIEELELLRESCKTVRERAFIEVFYATGCRLSEIQKLNVSDINFQSMSCKVIGKGNKEREVYLSFKALFHLKKYLQSRNDDCEALFVTQRKPYRRLTGRGIQREVKNISRNCGLEDKVHVHVLRHTFATLTLNQGADIVAIQEILGHSDPSTTQRYARITEERKREQHKKYLVL
ncbi:site-specific tyrosine recombinase/integron integrase [Sutcliffiella cohnii]|uniref:site-specific tyrosine recombinase/integron integrase n=1 Tax=Sutcliffiella cohnii TaxID=33932 RepID=UPI002E212489|nr:site-specific tyrosine recombinase/integron integrase [Sutcliffiella cohnii]MED4017010.1 tyrosine-type recombinase/integrase [Sutcliffiella cohnii]